MVTEPDKTEKPTPILVIGMNRSGTKWLSNILCNHPQIAGVQSERHTGIVETNMFGAMVQATGDIRRTENYIAMVELWSQTDFFKSSGVDKDYFYRCEPRPDSCETAFGVLLTRVAERKGARFWLQKASPLDLERALERFPEARLVLIERDMIPTLESRIQLRRNLGTGMSLAHALFLHALQKKLLARIAARPGVLFLRYEALRADTAGEVRRVCDWLGIPFEEQMLEVRYRKNTSFSDTAARERFVFRPHEKLLLRVGAMLFSLVPLAVLRWTRERFRTSSPPFIEGTFREIEERSLKRS